MKLTREEANRVMAQAGAMVSATGGDIRFSQAIFNCLSEEQSAFMLAQPEQSKWYNSNDPQYAYTYFLEVFSVEFL